VRQSAEHPFTPSAEDPTQITVGLRWKSGASQQVPATRRENAIQLRSTAPAAVELARRIGPALDNSALAAALNDAGHRTGTGQPFDATAAGNLRNYHPLPRAARRRRADPTAGRRADRGIGGHGALLDQVR
jgi:hypothetical protein